MDLRFPIGQVVLKDYYTSEEMSGLLHSVTEMPALYRGMTEKLTEEELLKTYREGGWNVRQLVHHVADMHLLHFFRMKKALTEPDYHDATLVDMAAWGNTADTTEPSVEWSLMILEGIHQRYRTLIRSLNEEQLNISYYHPVRKRSFDQRQALAITEWHGRHHLAHIKLALGFK